MTHKHKKQIDDLHAKAREEKWAKHRATPEQPHYSPEYVADLINRGREILRERKNK